MKLTKSFRRLNNDPQFVIYNSFYLNKNVTRQRGANSWHKCKIEIPDEKNLGLGITKQNVPYFEINFPYRGPHSVRLSKFWRIFDVRSSFAE